MCVKSLYLKLRKPFLTSGLRNTMTDQAQQIYN
jgi:hypothetical protein